jgi:hypothetical protein
MYAYSFPLLLLLEILQVAHSPMYDLVPTGVNLYRPLLSSCLGKELTKVW